MVKGKVWVLSLAVLLCLTLVSVGVVSSLQYANVSAVGPNGINATTFTATKNVWTLFNFSINISGITSYAGAPLNISSILIFSQNYADSLLARKDSYIYYEHSVETYSYRRYDNIK